MSIILLKIFAAASAGAFVIYLIILLLNAIRAAAGKFKAPSITVDTKAVKASLDYRQRIRRMSETLAQDPYSPESKKVKLLLSVLVFLAALLFKAAILFAIVFAIGAYIMSGKYYYAKIKKEKDKFGGQLIDGLGLIKNSIRAGQSLGQAIEYMVKESKPPLSVEFQEVLHKVQLGTSINDALSELAEKNKNRDLKIAVTSINLAKETGGNMAEIITILSDTMRERKKINGKVDSLTAQGRASGLVMSAMPFLLLAVLYFMEPTMVGLLFTTLLGNVMLIIVIAMVTLGQFIINKIVTIDI